jgi:hypothetical protein
MKLLFRNAFFVTIIAELVGAVSMFILLNWGSTVQAFNFVV